MSKERKYIQKYNVESVYCVCEVFVTPTNIGLTSTFKYTDRFRITSCVDLTMSVRLFVRLSMYSCDQNTGRSFQQNWMKLGTCSLLWPRTNPIDFGSNRYFGYFPYKCPPGNAYKCHIKNGRVFRFGTMPFI